LNGLDPVEVNPSTVIDLRNDSSAMSVASSPISIGQLPADYPTPRGSAGRIVQESDVDNSGLARAPVSPARPAIRPIMRPVSSEESSSSLSTLPPDLTLRQPTQSIAYVLHKEQHSSPIVLNFLDSGLVNSSPNNSQTRRQPTPSPPSISFCQQPSSAINSTSLSILEPPSSLSSPIGQSIPYSRQVSSPGNSPQVSLFRQPVHSLNEVQAEVFSDESYSHVALLPQQGNYFFSFIFGA